MRTSVRGRGLGLGFGLLIVATAAGASDPRAVFIPIEPPLGWDTASVTDISDDGLTVVGTLQRWGTMPYSRAFRWTRETGVEPLPLLDQSDTRSSARSISGDGTVIVGACLGPTGTRAAALWVGGGHPDLLDQGESAFARAISRDGRVIVGHDLGAREGMIWVDGVHAELGPFEGDTRHAALGLSRDGSQAVGLSGGDDSVRACSWSLAGAAVPIDPETAPSALSVAESANEDGSVIVGGSHDAAFRWSVDTGMVRLPGVGEEDAFAEANDVSADGSVVVGIAAPNYTYTAFVWRDGVGTRSLAEMLAEEFELQPRGWTLGGLYAISSDGLSMVGFGEVDYQVRSFIVRLACPADYNFDRTIDIADALDFIDEFNACSGHPGSCGTIGTPDINADGEVDVLDLLDFFEAFSTECDA